MKRRDFTCGLTKFLLAGPFVSLAVGPLVAGAAEREPIHWHDGMQTAWRSMQAEQRPMLLFITMDGCHHCTRMKSQTYRDHRVVDRIRESYVAAAVNGRRQPEIARRLGVRVYPTTVIISPEFRVVESIRGYVPPAELSARLAQLSQRMATVER